MDVGESDRGNVGNDLIGSHSLVLVPHDDIEHTDPVTRYASFAAAHTGRPADAILSGCGHDSSIGRL